MFDEIFEGSPIDKWKEIILNANPSVVSNELERLLDELAKYELLAQGVEPTFENLQREKKNLAILSMGNILSQNE